MKAFNIIGGRVFAWALCGLALAFPCVSNAAIISISFNELNHADNSTAAMAATDLAGANSSIRVANWNNLRGINNGSSRTLAGANTKYDDATTVGGTFSAKITHVGGTDFTSAPASKPAVNDAQLYYSSHRIWGSGNGPTTVELTGIPFAEYAIYVYVCGGVQNGTLQGGSIQRTGDTTTYYVKGTTTPNAQRPNNDGTGYVEISTTNFVDAASTNVGNYRSFTDLSGTSQTFTLAAMNMGNANAQRLSLSGIQIVSVPEPTSMAVLGSAGAFLLVRRRRQ